MSQITQDEESFGSESDAAPPDGTARVPLKGRGAARIKKPPFGSASRTVTYTAQDSHGGTEEALDPNAIEEGAFARWWRESGKVVAGGIVISGVWALAFSLYITASIGWRQLFTLLPDQFGSFMTTFMLPLAVLWWVVA